MKKIYYYINPLAHLGERRYSIIFPLVVMVLTCLLSELYAYGIAHDPMVVGVYIIFLTVALVIYFAFREGLRGGLIAVFVTICYYFYIIYSRHYHGNQMQSGINTTISLGVLYFILAGVIGWLKERIDVLIEWEADGKRRLEAIIEQLPVGVLITDSQGKLTQRNKQVDRILGIKMPIGFVIGQDTLTEGKISGESIKPTEAPLITALKSGKSVLGKEYAYERKDGKILHLQISTSPIHNKAKKVIAAASIINDITAQKVLEIQKDDFLSMASHELKTPITSMKMFIDLLGRQLQQIESKKATYYTDRIRDQANRLKELTNDLLDVSRIQTGKLRFSKEEFNLSEVVNDTIEGLKGTTKRHEIIFKNQYRELVVGDRYRIYQVIVNLITNAIKYSPNARKIIVQIKKQKQNVVVSVQDFGIGIKPEQQKKVFDRLYQVTDPEEKTFPGLGLGLYISKEIVDRHNGQMWVESIKGKGSTFFFSLPLAHKKR